MYHWLCWLFGSCVAATPAPPPFVPPHAVELAQPAPADAAPKRAGDLASMPAPPSPAPPPLPPSRPAPPGPPGPLRLTLAVPAVPQSARPALPELNIKLPEAADAGPPAWQRYAVAAAPAEGRPTLAVLIAGMGVNVVQSARAIALPGPLTLGWVPYAPELAAQIAIATAHGHEAVLDMPMEALGRLDPGPGALRSWLPLAANLVRLRAALDAVPSAVGLTEQEGSVAVLSVPLMDLVMGELRARRMAYLDNPMLPQGVALGRAEAAGVPAAERDVVIDADPSPAGIRARLAEAETLARRSGHAILVGRARPATLDALEQYLPTVPARGLVLWPISALIAERSGIEPAAADPVPRPPIRSTASAIEVLIAPAPASGAE